MGMQGLDIVILSLFAAVRDGTGSRTHMVHPITAKISEQFERGIASAVNSALAHLTPAYAVAA